MTKDQEKDLIARLNDIGRMLNSMIKKLINSAALIEIP
jgi:hypothetical protein